MSELQSVDFSQANKSIFNFLTLNGKYTVIGSSNLKDNLYTTDYDLQEFITAKDTHYYDVIYRYFLEKFKIQKKHNKTIFITDFKCGEKDGEPLRWNSRTILSKAKFINALKQESTIKLDVIALVNGIFSEYSENYYISIEGQKNYKEQTKDDVAYSIKSDIELYHREKNDFKALKRIFALLRLTKQNKSLFNKLQKYFNSIVGYLYANVSEFGVIELVLDFPVNMQDVYNNLQIIKQNISHVDLQEGMSALIDKLCEIKKKDILKKKIGELIKTLKEVIQRHTVQFINANRSIRGYLN